MSDYKLVPVEPTPEMLEAGADWCGQGLGTYEAKGRAAAAYKFMLAAAPAAQGELVGWRSRFLKLMGEIQSELDDSNDDPIPSELWSLWRELLDTTPQPAEQQPTCPTCLGGGWDIDCQNRFRPVTCPDCAGSGKFEHSITAQESDSVAPDVTALVEALEKARDAIASLPKDALGNVPDTQQRQGWHIRDELVNEISVALAAYRKQGADECYDCGDAIPPERRKAAPWAVRCVYCQEVRERKA